MREILRFAEHISQSCNFEEKDIMEAIQQQQPSTFAQMVDKLRNKSEAELKMLYLRFFSKELNEEWNTITQESNLENVTEEEIVKAIQKNRYKE